MSSQQEAKEKIVSFFGQAGEGEVFMAALQYAVDMEPEKFLALIEEKFPDIDFTPDLVQAVCDYAAGYQAAKVQELSEADIVTEQPAPPAPPAPAAPATQFEPVMVAPPVPAAPKPPPVPIDLPPATPSQVNEPPAPVVAPPAPEPVTVAPPAPPPLPQAAVPAAPQSATPVVPASASPVVPPPVPFWWPVVFQALTNWKAPLMLVLWIGAVSISILLVRCAACGDSTLAASASPTAQTNQAAQTSAPLGPTIAPLSDGLSSPAPANSTPADPAPPAARSNLPRKAKKPGSDTDKPAVPTTDNPPAKDSSKKEKPKSFWDDDYALPE